MKKYKKAILCMMVNYFHLQGYSISEIAKESKLKTGQVRRLIVK